MYYQFPTLNNNKVTCVFTTKKTPYWLRYPYTEMLLSTYGQRETSGDMIKCYCCGRHSVLYSVVKHAAITWHICNLCTKNPPQKVFITNDSTAIECYNGKTNSDKLCANIMLDAQTHNLFVILSIDFDAFIMLPLNVMCQICSKNNCKCTNYDAHDNICDCKNCVCVNYGAHNNNRYCENCTYNKWPSCALCGNVKCCCAINRAHIVAELSIQNMLTLRELTLADIANYIISMFLKVVNRQNTFNLYEI